MKDSFKQSVDCADFDLARTLDSGQSFIGRNVVAVLPGRSANGLFTWSSTEVGLHVHEGETAGKQCTPD